MAIYIYKMHAGQCGTDETFWSECLVNEDEYAAEHAGSYGVEQNEDGGWEEDGQETGDPECWMHQKVTTLTELEQVADELLTGRETLEDLLADIAKVGVTFE